jgi:hypothetical protein
MALPTHDIPADLPDPVVGAIYGFRWWRIGAGGELRSPWHGPYAWSTARNEARCLPQRRLFRGWRTTAESHRGQVPDRDCHCGFYGLWGLPSAIVFGRVAMLWDLEASTSGTNHALVLGIVEATGRVLLGVEGFRSEYARPVAIAVGSDVTCSPDIAAAGIRFGIPVYGSIEQLVGRWTTRIEESRTLTQAA